MPLWGWGAESTILGEGEEVVVRTCRARRARKELPVVFVQGVKCEMQPFQNKCLQSWSSNPLHIGTT